MPDLSRVLFQIDSAIAQVAPPAGGGGATPAAPAAGGGNGGGGAPPGGGLFQLALPILIFVAFYFFLIRPQQKKQKELDAKLKKGDRVFTNAGIIGKVVELNDRRVTLEVAKDVRMVFLRSAIGGIDESDPAKTEGEKSEKSAEAKK